MTNPDQGHGAIADHSRQLPRLRRIEGQIRGVQQMIEGARDCVDVINQIDAAIAALRRVQADMLHDHLNALTQAIVAGELSEADRRRLADEVSKAFMRRE